VPARNPQVPKYRHYKPKDLAVVRINGKDFYLGRFGSEESKERYRRLIAASLTAPLARSSQVVQSGEDAGLSVTRLVIDYWDRYVVTYYVKGGRPTSEQDNIRQALRFARRLYGDTPALGFGPLALRTVRESMIAAGRCRTLINKDVNRIRNMFRWAVEHEMIPVAVYQALQTVKALKAGRSAARETAPVKPVPEEVVRATLPFLPAQVAAMVQLQLLTGARPGEIIAIRPIDVDRSHEDGWTYTPASHKTEHHDKLRIIVFGPRAQAILRPWLDRGPHAYCFSPAEAEAVRNAAKRAARMSPMTPSQAARQPKTDPARKPSERYNRASYRRAVQRAARKAGVPVWHPHQLRHTRATEVRARYDLETARALLGHGSARVTEGYAERDLGVVRRVMVEIG
jgi:integrase